MKSFSDRSSRNMQMCLLTLIRNIQHVVFKWIKNKTSGYNLFESHVSNVLTQYICRPLTILSSEHTRQSKDLVGRVNNLHA